ncbi:MAG TPA: hypothetical protein VFP43_06190, partial [Mesorhizobium sp.]|nr:hypothetical protein [Mesorhizobium sp.]
VVKTMRAQVTVSKALNRHSEETLGLDIQIEESKFEESNRAPIAVLPTQLTPARKMRMSHRLMRACQFLINHR